MILLQNVSFLFFEDKKAKILNHKEIELSLLWNFHYCFCAMILFQNVFIFNILGTLPQASYGLMLSTYVKKWLLAVLGSPTMQMLMSPRRLVFSSVFLGTPPNSMSKMPFLISSLP